MGCKNSTQQTKMQPIIDTSAQSGLVLGYWGLRFRATVSKYLLEFTGLQYTEEKYMDPKDWFGVEAVKQSQTGFQFANLPYLKDGSFILTETPAIEQYIIKRSGRNELLGSCIKEQGQIKMLWGVINDFRESLVGFIFGAQDLNGQKQEKWEKEIKGFCDLFAMQLQQKSFLIGNGITWVDFILYETLQWVKGIWPEEFAKNDTLHNFCLRFEDIPKIKEYLNSNRHIKFPFFPPGKAKWTGLPEQK